ncbi:hypothetical protein BD560DRAFT_382413 [Blakeslea trispora]|nr:hypothetical protein BD560DRAFT_382413 [Blakeslea trispora]
MSNLDHYFTKRKSRVTVVERTKEEPLTHHVQAPQPMPIIKKAPQTKQRNSILYYLSPQLKKDDSNKEEVCQIRKSIPLADMWHVLLETFDAPMMHLSNTSFTLVEGRKRQYEEDDGTRNVRLRLHAQPFSIQEITEEEETEEEIEEDLSRPIRKRHSLETTQLYLLAVTREFSEEGWFY